MPKHNFPSESGNLYIHYSISFPHEIKAEFHSRMLNCWLTFIELRDIFQKMSYQPLTEEHEILTRPTKQEEEQKNRQQQGGWSWFHDEF